MSRYIEVEATADIDLYNYVDDFIDLILGDEDIIEELREKIRKKDFKLSGKEDILSIFQKPQKVKIEIPAITKALSKSEVYLHSCLKDKSRPYLCLNTLFLKENELVGMATSNGIFLLVTSFGLDASSFVNNLDQFTRYHIKSLVNQNPDEFKCNLFLKDGKIYNYVETNDFTIEPQFISDKDFEPVNFSKIIQDLNLDQIEEIDIAAFNNDEGGDIKIKDQYFSGSYIDDIKQLFINTKHSFIIPKTPNAPAGIISERNLLIMMPRGKK